MTMRDSQGNVRQSGLVVQPGDYNHERINHLVVGVVLAVHFSDDPLNATAIPISSQRGYACTVDVLAVAHGNDNPWIIPNVVVLPPESTGVDDFSDAIPRPSTLMTDGSQFDSSLSMIDYQKLDGDWVVVGFIGGSVEQPVMLGWWPHPNNNQDPATAGFEVQNSQTGPTDAQTLNQGRRQGRRFAGTTTVITAEGSVFLSTAGANAQISGSAQGLQRQNRDVGGDIQVDVKNARQLQINFNPPVPLPNTQPSIFQPNPPQGEQTRATTATVITCDKDKFVVSAGNAISLVSLKAEIDVHAKTKVFLRGDDASDAVLVGSNSTGDCDHIINGETFRDGRYNQLVSLVNDLITYINALTLPVSGATAGPPTVPFPGSAQPMQPVDLSTIGMVKRL